MNIFYLDENPNVAATMHCNKHVVKMILESAQLLSTAHRILDGDDKKQLSNNTYNAIMYKATHMNHPSAKWARESSEHYHWLYKLFIALCDEYTYRYNKVHASDTKLRHILDKLPKNIQDNGFVPPPQAMPDYCKNTDTVVAYRTYYINEKSKMLDYKLREKPSWIITNTKNQ